MYEFIQLQIQNFSFTNVFFFLSTANIRNYSGLAWDEKNLIFFIRTFELLCYYIIFLKFANPFI